MADDWWKVIGSFKPEEVMCPCGCGTVTIAFEIMWLAERLRDRYSELLLERDNDRDARLKISSGCRCPEHNYKIGGSPFSYHIAVPGRLEALALDIMPPQYRPYSMEALSEAAMFLNPPGLKIYHTWIHMDFRRDSWRG